MELLALGLNGETCVGRSDLCAEHILKWACARCACVAEKTCAMLEVVLPNCLAPESGGNATDLLSSADTSACDGQFADVPP